MVPRKSWISEILDPISESRKLLLRVTKSRFSCVSFGLGVSIFFRKVSEPRICLFSRGSPAKVIALSEQKSVLLHSVYANGSKHGTSASPIIFTQPGRMLI